MHAILIELLAPIIPLLLYLRTQRHTIATSHRLFIRFFLYALSNVLLITLVMMLWGSGGESITEKYDHSPAFALKFLILEALVVGVITLVDQTLLRYYIHFQISSSRGSTFVFRILLPALLPLLAITLVCLNGSLIFDHVLWGDEAFSVNTACNSVAGIMEILHYWDNHPPLYYLWLHVLISLLGQHGFVYHLSAFLPFALGIFWALTGFRRHFGSIPAALFVIVSGLALPCLQYNQEVRMYALAFLALTLCYYYSYLAIMGKKTAWFFMVFFGLAAAYSHYYALAAAGILLFFTGLSYFIHCRGRAWIPGVLSILCFILGYLPWLPQLLDSTSAVANNWWMTDVLPVRDALIMICGGETMWKILFPLFLLLISLVLVLDCRILQVDAQPASPGTAKGHLNIRLCSPSIRNWTECTYSCIIGLLTIGSTLLFAYLLCAVMGPVLAQRYLYPLCGIFVMTLAMAFYRIEEWLREQAPVSCRPVMLIVCKYCMLAVCGILLFIGLHNFRVYQSNVKMEKAGTIETLSLIGEPDKSVPMAVTGVKHLSWTILQHYYPGHDILSESCDTVEADAFWYFSGQYLSEEQITMMTERGYTISGYGEHRISQYTFILYYFEK